MQKQGIDALKRMALMAKNRLRNKVRENDNKTLQKGDRFKVLFGEGVDIKSKIITKEDAKLYGKVKQMLDENEDVVNPLAKLIDYKIYNKLNDTEKERYLLVLVNKYKQYKIKYYDERIKQVI
ncbi:MAG: hypothetical protein MRZ90_01080 [Candidatus Gastranaerophilales bacterium]|nr:hypothetical protein [Candidatus Gastranaerophilales bacterium]